MSQEINRTLIGGGEGFAIYTEERDGKFLLIIDESTMLAILSEEDAEGLSSEKILEFSSAQERENHIATLRFSIIR